MMLPKTDGQAEAARARLLEVYRAAVDELAARLDSGIRSGFYRGWEVEDAERFPGPWNEARPETMPPRFRLERVCGRTVWCRTEPWAYLTLALSRSTPATVRDNKGVEPVTVRALACEAMAREVLAAAARREVPPGK